MNNSYNQISVFESEILSLLTKEKVITIDTIVNKLQIPKSLISTIIDRLLSQQTISMNEKSEYIYREPIKDDIIILDGDLLLPVAFIERSDALYVTRGQWYKLPKGFDTRRIIWNCRLNNHGTDKNNSLVDILTNQQLVAKEKSNRIQLEEYINLVNKLIPYSDNVKLHITKVCEDITEVNIIIYINMENDSISVTHNTFRIKSEISTNAMLAELNKSPDERDFSNIGLEMVVEYSDIIFSKNEIPFSLENNVLNYIRIDKIKSGLSYSIMKKTVYNGAKQVDVTNFDTISEGIENIIELCGPFIKKLLAKYKFILED